MGGGDPQRRAGVAGCGRQRALWRSAAAQRIRGYLPEQGQLFVGNSHGGAPDRLAQLPAGYPVYGNRGASGIDGLIALRPACSAGTDRRWPSLAISALYDHQLAGPAAPGVSAAGADRGE
ncbi:hypothetical protein MJ579_20340 [Klebsiella pneumoniae]|nr:hypothetical protein MJ579_20340 [Klebsiella pneumoniae]